MLGRTPACGVLTAQLQPKPSFSFFSVGFGWVLVCRPSVTKDLLHVGLRDLTDSRSRPTLSPSRAMPRKHVFLQTNMCVIL